MDIDVSVLIGKTLKAIDVQFAESRVIFETTDGERYLMHHQQDCCENVHLRPIEGLVSDLIGNPLTMAEESTNRDGPKLEEWDDSFTWTFYRFATIRGYVTISWYGSSNGYYSESVSFELQGPAGSDE